MWIGACECTQRRVNDPAPIIYFTAIMCGPHDSISKVNLYKLVLCVVGREKQISAKCKQRILIFANSETLWGSVFALCADGYLHKANAPRIGRDAIQSNPKIKYFESINFPLFLLRSEFK